MTTKKRMAPHPELETIRLDETQGSVVELEPESGADVGQTQPVSEPMLKHQIGHWAGYPNFGCPHCPFTTLDGTGTVDIHILERRSLATSLCKFDDPHLKEA